MSGHRREFVTDNAGQDARTIQLGTGRSVPPSKPERLINTNVRERIHDGWNNSFSPAALGLKPEENEEKPVPSPVVTAVAASPLREKLPTPAGECSYTGGEPDRGVAAMGRNGDGVACLRGVRQRGEGRRKAPG